MMDKIAKTENNSTRRDVQVESFNKKYKAKILYKICIELPDARLKVERICEGEYQLIGDNISLVLINMCVF